MHKMLSLFRNMIMLLTSMYAVAGYSMPGKKVKTIRIFEYEIGAPVEKRLVSTQSFDTMGRMTNRTRDEFLMFEERIDRYGKTLRTVSTYDYNYADTLLTSTLSYAYGSGTNDSELTNYYYENDLLQMRVRFPYPGNDTLSDTTWYYYDAMKKKVKEAFSGYGTKSKNDLFYDNTGKLILDTCIVFSEGKLYSTKSTRYRYDPGATYSDITLYYEDTVQITVNKVERKDPTGRPTEIRSVTKAKTYPKAEYTGKTVDYYYTDDKLTRVSFMSTTDEAGNRILENVTLLYEYEYWHETK